MAENALAGAFCGCGEAASVDGEEAAEYAGGFRGEVGRCEAVGQLEQEEFVLFVSRRLAFASGEQDEAGAGESGG